MSSTNKHSDNLSREEIQAYLSSNDEKVKHAIEKKSLTNHFDEEALNGWSENASDLTGLQQLDKKFKPSSLNYYWIGSSIVAASLIIGTVFFMFSPKNESTQLATITQVEKTDYILPDSVQKMVESPQKERISIQKMMIKKQVSALEKSKESKEFEEKETTVKEAESINILPVHKPEVKSERQILKKIAAKEIYLNELKLVDYRAYRSKPFISVESLQLSGVPADKESKEEQLKEAEKSMVEIAYFDYIKKTTKLLNEGDFKQTLARCNIILSYYPDDINALFYSGVCYYNLSDYTNAIEAFKHCLESKFDNFDEEAEWLLAKSYDAKGDKEKSKAMFQLIKERGGYYSKKF
jgi:TolA-binding protein